MGRCVRIRAETVRSLERWKLHRGEARNSRHDLLGFAGAVHRDQTALLGQVGWIERTGLPVSGAEQAARLRDPVLPSNQLIPISSP